MEETTERSPKIYRWIFLAILVLSILTSIWFPPVQPEILLPAERISEAPLFGDFYLTNTLIATLLADILLILLAVAVRRATQSGTLVLSGITGAVSAILEGLYSLTESTAGRHARRIFPYFATIFLLVLVANWMELIPGVDSIGLLHHAGEGHTGHAVQEILPGVASVVAEEAEDGYVLVPFVRVASTDLNFTIALAVISVVMTQVIGLRALGTDYLRKYWNTSKLALAFRQPRMGGPLGFLTAFIDLAVGILEIVAEFSKIISFAFRLFGNIFAGSVMLFVIGSLVPVFVQSVILLLELFVGLIQAFVFGMLTMVFMSLATHSHAEHVEEPEEMPVTMVKA